MPPRDASLNDSEVQPASAVDVAPEVEVSIEDESRLGVGSDGPIAAEPESPISVESESLVSPELEVSPGQQEVDRRRGIVRAFFNDYWSSVDDKPASFAERLDLAEGYINERVAAGGEAWRLRSRNPQAIGTAAIQERVNRPRFGCAPRTVARTTHLRGRRAPGGGKRRHGSGWIGRWR